MLMLNYLYFIFIFFLFTYIDVVYVMAWDYHEVCALYQDYYDYEESNCERYHRITNQQKAN